MDKPTNNEIQLISLKILSKYMALSVRQLQRLTRCGLIPKPMKLSGSLRWRRTDILLFLDCGCDVKLYEERKESSDE
jgi:predicted DNA-binding transcriptional regulator AlpA